jgi:hypothetical protein
MGDVTLRATKSFSYSTRRLKAGDEFTVPERMAKVLVGIRKAEHLREVGRVVPPPAGLVEKATVTERRGDDAFDGFLDRSIPQIAADLEKLDEPALRDQLEAEKKGKSRKGLIAAMEAELEARNS